MINQRKSEKAIFFVARSRLRKKLNIETEENLINFLIQF